MPENCKDVWKPPARPNPHEQQSLLEESFSQKLRQAVQTAVPRSWIGRHRGKLGLILLLVTFYALALLWMLYPFWKTSLPPDAKATLLTMKFLIVAWFFRHSLDSELAISVPPLTNRPVNATLLYEFARRSGLGNLRIYCLLHALVVVATVVSTVWIRGPSASPVRWMLSAAGVILVLLSSAGLWVLANSWLRKLESILPAAATMRNLVIFAFIIGLLAELNDWKPFYLWFQAFPQASIFQWLLGAGPPPLWKLLVCLGLILPLLRHVVEYWRNRPPLPEPEFFATPFEPRDHCGNRTMMSYHLLGLHPGGNQLVDTEDDDLENHTAEKRTDKTSNDLENAATDPMDALPPEIAKLNLHDQLARLLHTNQGTQVLTNLLNPISHPLRPIKSFLKAWFYAGMILVFSLWIALPLSTWSEGFITAWFDLKPRSLGLETYLGSVVVLLGLSMFWIAPILKDLSPNAPIYQPWLDAGIWLKVPVDPRDSTQFDTCDRRQILDIVKILAAGALGVWLAVGVVWILERYTGLHFSGYRDKLTLGQIYLGGGGTLCAAHVWLPVLGLFILLDSQRPRRSSIALSSRVRWLGRFRFLTWLQVFLTIINHACCLGGLFVAGYALVHWSPKAAGGALLLWTAPFGLSILHQIILRHLQDHGRGDFIPSN